ncbi:daunorubicin/doxorubicin resistance ABC transporter ATP-binding protein DrrA [Spongiactinospora gelatinilytica]|uniref:Daunorubicin/doxorubicin resistance ABC transporter ATP-binding protein DrrA n=1 Tax=Spongiactinospora gelatinilytica TaxID=2666298 RepID=A0A2W2HU64_9ACTN|nr:ATP-binding cassette domain-containing protein [Spongiactinospora gelatinilytica]PZG53368.1 daunorubicin/doxorubicin resistance ABC transporter ATP-binding protein DrrA [Spongiactinospora gelatinilytica]
MSYAIRAENLSKTYGSTRALDGVGFAARSGQVLGVLGPNGAGKTTAVRILATLAQPDGGVAEVGGHDVVRQAKEVRKVIGLTGQYAAVDEIISGFDNLFLIGRLLGMSREESRSRATRLLEQFGLTDAAKRSAGTYSGGMRRRLDLAASLLGRPRVLFLDEPTTGLDPAARDDLWDVIRDLVADGTTVLLTTQYLEEADQLADHIVVFDHGHVIAEGSPHELKSKLGGQVLEVWPVDPGDREEVSAILGEIARTPATVEDRRVTVPMADRDGLRAAVLRLDLADIAVAELALRSPSLDEVFLTLTGHREAVGGRSA